MVRASEEEDSCVRRAGMFLKFVFLGHIHSHPHFTYSLPKSPPLNSEISLSFVYLDMKFFFFLFWLWPIVLGVAYKVYDKDIEIKILQEENNLKNPTLASKLHNV